MSSLYSETDVDMKKFACRHYSLVYQSEFGQAAKTGRFELYPLLSNRSKNERLVSGKRIITVWKKTERITVQVIIDRQLSEDPESFYLKFLLDGAKVSAAVSSMGGRVFEFGRGQLDFSNFDSTSIDGWIAYPYDDLLFTSKRRPCHVFRRSELLCRAENTVSGLRLSVLLHLQQYIQQFLQQRVRRNRIVHLRHLCGNENG